MVPGQGIMAIVRDMHPPPTAMTMARQRLFEAVQQKQ